MTLDLFSMFNQTNSLDPKIIIEAAKPYITTISAILIAALIAFSLFKTIILAKDLAAAGDDPQRRSEIKKAFMYTLIAPIIGIVASSIIIALVESFGYDPTIINK